MSDETKAAENIAVGDAATGPVTEVYRDPRQGVPLDRGKHRVYVFSYPDPEVAKTWGEEKGIPSKYWDAKKSRLKVQEPYLNLALILPKAPKKVLEALEPPPKG